MGSEIKLKYGKINLFMIFLLTISVYSQAVDKCYTFDGINTKNCGEKWTDYYNGVEYDCHCDCSNRQQPTVCIPKTTSNNDSNNYSTSDDENSNSSNKIEQQRVSDERIEKERVEKEKQESFDKGKNELLKQLKNESSKEMTVLKSDNVDLPYKNLQDSKNNGLNPYETISKEKKIKIIKELNCSAYWGIKAANAALSSKQTVTKNFEDEFTEARKFAEYSAKSKDGKTVSGCPQVKIYIPELDAPFEYNSQKIMYESIVEGTKTLLPEIIETKEKIKKSKQDLKDIIIKKTKNRNEKDVLLNEIMTTKNEIDKQNLGQKYIENKTEYDKLTEDARELERIAGDLVMTADEQKIYIQSLQDDYNKMQVNPKYACEVMEKINEEMNQKE